MKFRIGLKVWSINHDFLDTMKKIIENNLCQYVEIYYIPGSSELFFNWWPDFPIPVLVHGPTTRDGLNPAVGQGKNFLEETLNFADRVQSEKIIFHPGMGGNLENVLSFFSCFSGKRLIIENMPFYSLDWRECQGAPPEEINTIVQEIGCSFCLDVGHGAKYACSKDLDFLTVIKRFEKINPFMYHISDGFIDNDMDEHLNMGNGDIPYQEIFQIIDSEKAMTLETAKSSSLFYDEYEKDYTYTLKALRREL